MFAMIAFLSVDLHIGPGRGPGIDQMQITTVFPVGDDRQDPACRRGVPDETQGTDPRLGVRFQSCQERVAKNLLCQCRFDTSAARISPRALTDVRRSLVVPIEPRSSTLRLHYGVLQPSQATAPTPGPAAKAVQGSTRRRDTKRPHPIREGGNLWVRSFGVCGTDQLVAATPSPVRSRRPRPSDAFAVA